MFTKLYEFFKHKSPSDNAKCIGSFTGSSAKSHALVYHTIITNKIQKQTRKDKLTNLKILEYSN